jgi:DNA-3-methyladenine glycosylase II
MTDLNPLYDKARRSLSRRDPVLKTLIRQIGPCTLRTRDDHFALLVRSIVSQQISTKAAIAISTRLLAALQPSGLCPAAILAAEEETLRLAGLSTAKRRSLRDLAEKVHAGHVPLERLPELPDEEVINQLIPVRGIGRWTAEMFLIFGLGRMDILPVADFGLRNGVKRLYGLDELPGKQQLVELGESWRPYRSVATWYFWRSFGNVPQSEPASEKSRPRKK